MMRSQETFYGLKRLHEVKALQSYNPGKKSSSQPPNIVQSPSCKSSKSIRSFVGKVNQRVYVQYVSQN